MSIASSAPPDVAPAAPARAPRWRADLLVTGIALVLAVWVTSGLWIDPNGRAIKVNSSDQALFEWLLSYGARAITHGENPFFTHLIGFPDGANLAVNTSITVYAVLFAPLTYLVGAPVTFLVILTLNLVATAYAWFWLLSRHLVSSRLAAATGALVIAFAPSMVSHANAHLNWTAGWLVPMRGLAGAAAARRALAARRRDPRRPGGGRLLDRRRRPVLHRPGLPGLPRHLVTVQGHPGRGAGRAAGGPARPRRHGGRRGGAARVPHVDALPRVRSASTAPASTRACTARTSPAYFAFPQRSLAGIAGLDTRLAPNETEENSFFGLPLVLLTVAAFWYLWRVAAPGRRATLRALGVTALVFAVLSWGPAVKIFKNYTDIPLPYALLNPLPVFNAALPQRLALVVTPIVGLLLALLVDARPRGRVWPAAFAVALVPILPVNLLTVAREPIPVFITSGAWTSVVPPGGVLATVPFTLDTVPDGQRWQAYAWTHGQGEFAIASGFYLGPGGPDGRGRIGPVPRYMDGMLYEVAQTGVRAADRAGRAGIGKGRPGLLAGGRGGAGRRIHGAKWPVQHDALLTATRQLLGPGERIDDVWVWRLKGS